MNIMRWFRKTAPEEIHVELDPTPELRARILQLEESVHKLERSIGALVEEVEERVDRGNKIWRRIRRAQQSQASAEDELEGEEEWGEFPGGDVEGGQPQGMPPVQGALDFNPGTPPDWEAKKRLINRQLAGLE